MAYLVKKYIPSSFSFSRKNVYVVGKCLYTIWIVLFYYWIYHYKWSFSSLVEQKIGHH